jgi:hypothetical protein
MKIVKAFLILSAAVYLHYVESTLPVHVKNRKCEIRISELFGNLRLPDLRRFYLEIQVFLTIKNKNRFIESYGFCFKFNLMYFVIL